jgi:hypothetical protein
MTLVESPRRSDDSTLGVQIVEVGRHAIVEKWLNEDEEGSCD